MVFDHDRYCIFLSVDEDTLFSINYSDTSTLPHSNRFSAFYSNTGVCCSCSNSVSAFSFKTLLWFSFSRTSCLTHPKYRGSSVVIFGLAIECIELQVLILPIVTEVLREPQTQIPPDSPNTGVSALKIHEHTFQLHFFLHLRSDRKTTHYHFISTPS